MRSKQSNGSGVVVVVGILLLGSVAGVVSAAGETGLSVTPATSSVSPGETTTLDVVLESADGGVGAAELRIAVDDPTVASIRNVSVRHDPMSTKINRTADGSQVDIAYIGANTDDSGRVSVITVTVEGEAAGTTGISLLPRDDNDDVIVFDEEGTGYDLTGIDDARLTVEEGSDGGNGGAAGGSGDNDGTDDSPDGSDSASGGDDESDSGTSAPDSTTEPTTAVEASDGGGTTSQATTSSGDAPATEDSKPMRDENASDREGGNGEPATAGPVTSDIGPLSIVGAVVGALIVIGVLIAWGRRR